MTDRIDHAAEAQGCLTAFDQIGYANDEGYQKQEFMAQAQVHATLALVEQQRIANILDIAKEMSASTHRISWLKHTHPDIAAALGIEDA